MYIVECPTCGRRMEFERSTDALHRPFCSKRCQFIDLDKWFRGEYRLSEPLPDDAWPDATDGSTDSPAPPWPAHDD